MASAVAVGVDEARSPVRNTIGDDAGYPGEITSGVYAKDEAIPGVNGEQDEDEDDDDDDLPSNLVRRGQRRKEDVEEDEGQEGPVGDDLFGDDDDEAAEESEKVRKLDDEELDSGDDLDRDDRDPENTLDAEAEPQFVEQEKAVMDLEISRQPVPEPSDGELYLLKVPDFMSIEPQAWDYTTFQPPTTDHHSNTAPSATFSAYNTALTTIRWRHSPSNAATLQSNARINRWSDGSITLQLASDPTIQYEIDGKTLAPPQHNPFKPTPTSIQTSTRAGVPNGVKYDQRKDAFTYLMRPHEASSSLIVTHKLTAGLSVKQSGSVEDDAIERLQASLAAASNASKVQGASGNRLIQIDEDPEAARARALEAVRQKEKADKRHQSAMDREAARSNRALGRSGLTSSRYSGLNVGMLEDDDMEGGAGRQRLSPNKARDRNPRRRRNSEYSEDEDLGRRRFTKEDEYDEDDDFVARSDEEEEVVEDDDDSNDGIVEDQPVRSPKRDRPSPGADDEADAPGEDDDEDEVQQARTKRRRVIDEEDDDE